MSKATGKRESPDEAAREPLRKPDRRVQVNLRILESERRKIAEAARRRGTTLNGMMAWAVMSALEQEVLLTGRKVVEDLTRNLTPLLGEVHQLNVSGDYRRAVAKLTALLRPLLAQRLIDGRTGEAIAAVLDEIESADRVVELELGRRLRQMHTTGAPR